MYDLFRVTIPEKALKRISVVRKNDLLLFLIENRAKRMSFESHLEHFHFVRFKKLSK